MTATEDYSCSIFLDFFVDLEDPRIERHKLYLLDEILLITLYVYICDAKDWEDIQEFGKTCLDFIIKYKIG